MAGSRSDFDDVVPRVTRQQLVRDAIERATTPQEALPKRQSFEEHRENWSGVIAFFEGVHPTCDLYHQFTREEIEALPRIPGKLTLEMIVGGSRLQFDSQKEWLRYCFPEMAAQ